MNQIDPSDEHRRLQQQAEAQRTLDTTMVSLSRKRRDMIVVALRRRGLEIRGHVHYPERDAHAEEYERLAREIDAMP